MSLTETGLNLKKVLPLAIQTRLGIAVPVSRALGDINAAMRDLDMSDEEVLLLLEARALIGFNIGAGGTGNCARILTSSIEHFKASQGKAALVLAWPEIFRLIFPRAFRNGILIRTALTGLEIKAGLNCTRGHVENIGREFFKTINAAKPGRGNTPSFTTASVERWLKARQL